MEYKKIGNRYYKLEEDIIYKATYNEEDDKYIVCGEWSTEVFLAHATPFDGNTEVEYDNIKTELGL